MRYFSKEHEWVDVDGELAVIGITRYAADQLGDIVFVELPEPGRSVKAGGDAAVVESVKAASDVFAPLSGTVQEVNETLADDPALVNADPEGKGWFFRMALADTGELGDLMNADEYEAYTATL